MTSAIGNRRVPSAATALRSGLAAAIIVGLGGPPLAAAEPPPVRLETTAGEAVSGGLQKITAHEVTLEVDGRSRGWPVAEIRRVLRTDAAVAAPAGVVVTLVDGGRITGDDFSWTDDRAAVMRPSGNVELSIDRIMSVAWRRQEDNAEWRSAVPEKPESDLVVVARTGADGALCSARAGGQQGHRHRLSRRDGSFRGPGRAHVSMEPCATRWYVASHE